MLLVSRALLVLGLAALLHAAGRSRAGSLKLRLGAKPKGKTVRLILDPSVQPQIASTSVSTIARTSLSPWTYRDSCVASRLPRQISNAHCLTSSCSSLHGGGEDMVLVSKPIYYQVLVLHRVPRQSRTRQGGRRTRVKHDFRLGTEVITVGCTCVRPSVLPQQ